MAHQPALARALSASVRPLHLAPLGVGAAVGAGLLAFGLAPLAVAVAAVSGGTWLALVAVELSAAPPPPPSRDRSAGAQTAVERAAARVSARIASEDGVLGASMAEVAASVRALVDQAAALAARGDAIAAVLAEHDTAAVATAAERLREQARAARDPGARASLASAAEARA
ncbi:MAG: hypothetical protein ABMA64_39820, partial [Myxococcota bacterium]